MIEYRKQSVLEPTENAIIAHGVNCQGKMNSGVAKAVREKYEKAYTQYMRLFDSFKDNNDFLVGSAQVVRVNDKNLHVANLFTQLRYGYDSIEYAHTTHVYKSLLSLGSTIYSNGELPTTVYMPRIGCGYGGLTWDRVLPCIEHALRHYPMKVIVCDL